MKLTGEELRAYNPKLMELPQVIAANKIDVIYEDGENENPLKRLKREFDPQGIPVFPISAVSGKGVNELLYHVRKLLDTLDPEPVIFQPEFVMEVDSTANLPYTVWNIRKIICMWWKVQE